MKPPVGRVEKGIVQLLLFNLQMTGKRECVSISHISRNFTGLRKDTVAKKAKALEKKGLVVIEGDRCVRLSSDVKVKRR